MSEETAWPATNVEICDVTAHLEDEFPMSWGGFSMAVVTVQTFGENDWWLSGDTRRGPSAGDGEFCGQNPYRTSIFVSAFVSAFLHFLACLLTPDSRLLIQTLNQSGTSMYTRDCSARQRAQNVVMDG